MTDDVAARRARTQAFLEYLGREIPGCRIAFKDDPPSTMPWKDRLLHALGRVFVPQYQTRYTTVIHPTIYFYEGARGRFEATPEQFYTTLRHEFVHLKDFQRFPLWMTVSYAGLLPVGWTMRAFWELRGYTQNLLCEYERTGQVSDAEVERVAEIFAGRGYIYMMLPKRRARRALLEIRAKIEAGELRGPYPYGPLRHAPPE